MRTNANGTKILEPGDQISCQGITCTVATIAYQEYWEEDGFRTEFTDTAGNYRSWKQNMDGGYVIAKNGGNEDGR
ncbi:MAG: hypothetical protein LUE86_05730 [Clostridiales bacterium]|nr:hypothetical protein [Clostridiales bacterium]